MKHEKLILNLPPELVEAIEKKAKREKKKKEDLIKELLAFYLSIEDRKTRIKKEIVKSYKTSSETSLFFSREFFEIEQELYREFFKNFK
ncbi:MAG: ribbon-helix-helix protein, CopG family [Caldisericia bacterium]